jgi:hypothetical protein
MPDAAPIDGIDGAGASIAGKAMVIASYLFPPHVQPVPPAPFHLLIFFSMPVWKKNALLADSTDVHVQESTPAGIFFSLIPVAFVSFDGIRFVVLDFVMYTAFDSGT